jgi:hypothetical protein
MIDSDIAIRLLGLASYNYSVLEMRHAALEENLRQAQDACERLRAEVEILRLRAGDVSPETSYAGGSSPPDE